MRESPMDKFPEETRILRDSTYPPLAQLLTLYRDNGNLNQVQRNFLTTAIPLLIKLLALAQRAP